MTDLARGTRSGRGTRSSRGRRGFGAGRQGHLSLAEHRYGEILDDLLRLAGRAG